MELTCRSSRNPFHSLAKVESGPPAPPCISASNDPTCASRSPKCIHRHLNIAAAPVRHQLSNRLAAWILLSTCNRRPGLGGPRDRCTDPQAPSRPSSNAQPQTWPTLHANLPATAARPSLSSLLAAAARSCAEAGTLQGEKFPHALRRLSPARAHLAAHLHPAAGAVLLEARFGWCTGQPNNYAKIPTHPCFRRRSTAPPGAASVVFLSESSSPGLAGRPAAAAAVHAARSPGLEPRAEALGVRRLAGGGGEAGRRRTAAGGGGRGARSQSAAQITAQPAGSSAGSRVCSVLPPPPLLLAAWLLPAPHHSRRRRTAKPLSRRPLSLFSRCLLLPNLERKGRGGEKPWRPGRLAISERREEGGRRGGGCGRGAASWRALPARGLEAGLILERESSPTGLSGLEENTSAPSCLA